MSKETTCPVCGLRLISPVDADIFLDELASIKKHGLCIACKFNADVASKIAKLRKEDDTTEAAAVLETNHKTKGES
jgi:hypothetical protein